MLIKVFNKEDRDYLINHGYKYITSEVVDDTTLYVMFIDTSKQQYDDSVFAKRGMKYISTNRMNFGKGV